MTKILTIDVHKARGENYAHHFDCRKQASIFDKETLSIYQEVARCVRPAGLNLFGAIDRSKEDWYRVIDMANSYKLDAWFINPFYLSDPGWTAFQEEWKRLPELIHIPFIQTDPSIPTVQTRENTSYTKAEKISTGHVDNSASYETYPQAEPSFQQAPATYPQKRKVIHNSPLKPVDNSPE